MFVNDTDLGPPIPVCYRRWGDRLDPPLSGYRATKHFTMYQHPECRRWFVTNGHGTATDPFAIPEQALEMAQYLEDLPIDWNTIVDGRVQLSDDMRKSLAIIQYQIRGGLE